MSYTTVSLLLICALFGGMLLLLELGRRLGLAWREVNPQVGEVNLGALEGAS